LMTGESFVLGRLSCASFTTFKRHLMWVDGNHAPLNCKGNENNLFHHSY